MSKFEIEISGAPFMKTFLLRYAGETLEIAAADLADLATAAQAALAEQNSGVAGGTCACDGRDYYTVDNRTPACNEFVSTVTYPDVCYCGHDEACHQSQAQRREA